MKRPYYYIFVLFFFAILPQVVAAERTYNILFVQSYSQQTPWHSDLNNGLIEGFNESGVKVNITTEYLDADFWTFKSEKLIMTRYCQRAKERKTDLIVTAGDEAFYSLFACGDSLPYQIPVVFSSIKYPDHNLIAELPNVCGLTANPNFLEILRQAKKVFPNRKEIIGLIDDSFLSKKGKDNFEKEWRQFLSESPGYSMKFYNTQTETTNHIISSICNVRNSNGRVVIAPKWSPFLSFVGKNSKAPVFACQNVGLTNGVFCAYDVNASVAAKEASKQAATILKGTSPINIGVGELEQGFIYDFKQLDFFHVSSDKVASSGVIVNVPYWEKYKLLFIFLYPSILALLIASIVWLYRVNRRESRRRMHAQTRLLVQNKLVEQRNEFDNIFHSIRDAVITYDINLNIHFTNRALLKMLHLPHDTLNRPYEGMMAGSLFKIYYNGQDTLRSMLMQVANSGHSVLIPKGAFMKEVHSENYFPVSGEIVPIRSNGQLTGMVLSARNISDEEMQKRIFDMAVEESSIFPWQFDTNTECFTFPKGFLARFGYDESMTIIARSDMDKMVHRDDLEEIRALFNKALRGEEKTTRLNFRQRNALGEYEWWEYRSLVIAGLTTNSLYNIIGVCQNVQRYKSVEQELRSARDKALQADKLKSAFLANMSHEIRTPLNAIVGFSDLLSDTSLFTAEEVAQFVATINKNCSLLLALINDILDLSRIESGTMEFQFAKHNLSLILKTVHDSQRLNMPPGVELLLQMPECDEKYLDTDNVRLQQVVNNLINNAAKFTSSGSITFGYEDDEDPDYTNLFVQDTGVGISQEGLKHIFERFYKVDNFTQGAGLGLSICHTITDRLSGTISVTSELGKGTRFTVRIPNTCH